MGSACTKSNENQVMQPQNNLEIAINSEFTPFLRIDHPFNVNHKYSSFCSYLKNEYTGQGIKKTHSYKTKLTKEELAKKRDEFWETRVEGVKTSWQILQKAVEAQEKDSIAFLAAGGLKLVNKSMQIAYDEQGHKYDVPIFCINEPVSFEQLPAHERNIVKEFEEKPVNIVIRCTKVPTDVTLEKVKNTLTVSELKAKFQEKVTVKFEKIRFFVSGKELHDHHLLGNYCVEDEQKVIQAYAFEKDPNAKNN